MIQKSRHQLVFALSMIMSNNLIKEDVSTETVDFV